MRRKDLRVLPYGTSVEWRRVNNFIVAVWAPEGWGTNLPRHADNRPAMFVSSDKGNPAAASYRLLWLERKR